MKKLTRLLIALLMVLSSLSGIHAKGSLPAVEKITWQSYQYYTDAAGVRFSWTPVAGADGYEIKQHVDGYDVDKHIINYTTYVFVSQDGAYNHFMVRPYKVENGQKVFGPWKTFHYTEKMMDKLTAKTLYYKNTKTYQRVMLRSLSKAKASYKKAMIVEGHYEDIGPIYSGTGKTYNYKLSPKCKYYTCDEKMFKETNYWKLIKVNKSTFKKSFKKYAILGKDSLWTVKIKGKKYVCSNLGHIAYVKVKNKQIVELRLLLEQ